MRRMERRRAEREGGAPRTLQEIDFLLLVDDEARQGALRFAETKAGRSCGRRGSSASRRCRAPETALRGRTRHGRERYRGGIAHAVCAGIVLGGARPKASVIEKDGSLAIAKFPRKDDEINTVVWEAVALPSRRKPVSPFPNPGSKPSRKSPFFSCDVLTGTANGAFHFSPR